MALVALRRGFASGFCAAIGVFFSGPAPAAGLPPVSAHAPHFLVPIQNGRTVYRFGGEGPPRVLEFWRAKGREWRVYWDSLLDTPRSLYPLEPVKVSEPEPMVREPRPGFVQAVERFIDENAEFLGAGTAVLSDPFVYGLAGSWVLVFQQTTPGGTPVRGANLRVVVHEDGRLGWIRAFVARGIGDPEGALLSREEVEGAAAEGGGTVLTSELQIGFLSSATADAAPIWSLGVVDAEGEYSEHIVNARTGETLARRVVEKRLDGEGAAEPFQATGFVDGYCPDPHDVFLSPATAAMRSYRIPEALIRDPSVPQKNPESKFLPLAIADESGEFSIPVALESLSLNAALKTGALTEDGYAPLLEVSRQAREDCLEDRAPDQTVGDQPVSQEFHFSFNRGGTDIERLQWAWLLQSYHHTRKMLRSLERLIGNIARARTANPELFLPVRPLLVKHAGAVAAFDDESSYEPGPELLRCSRIRTSLKFPGDGLDAQGRPIKEDVIPTWLQHEVGHHIFFHLTGSHDDSESSRAIEEGVCDVLAAFENKAPELHYRKDASGELWPTTRSFSLAGHDRRDFRQLLRVEVGEAFWRLRALFAERFEGRDTPEDERPKFDPENARILLVLWLGFNRTSRGDQRILDQSADLFDQLLRADDTPVFDEEEGNDDPRDGTAHKEQLEEAFIRSGRLIFELAFLRGDANLDGKLDISDAVSILHFLFGGQGTFHDCRNSLDADDSGKIDIADAVRIFLFLFQGGAPIPEPFGECGLDSEDVGFPGNLGCLDPYCPS